MQNCFTPSNPNPLAPAWLFPSELLLEAPAGYRDDFHMQTLTQALTASQVTTAQLTIDISGNCNFYWRAFGVFLYGGTGKPAIRIRDNDGFVMFNTPICLENDSPFGRQDYFTPIYVAQRLAPGSQMAIDFQETSGNAVTALLMFSGFRRWKE